jgi:hypothetical protein
VIEHFKRRHGKRLLVRRDLQQAQLRILIARKIRKRPRACPVVIHSSAATENKLVSLIQYESNDSRGEKLFTSWLRKFSQS